MSAKILYALIARENVVLAEFTSTGGNFPTVTRMLLHKISSNEDHKMSYTYDQHIFHYIVEAGVTYLCMADVELRRRLPFAFLADVKQRFQSTYGDHVQTANAFAMNEDFSPVLQRQMSFYNENPAADPINKVQSQIKDVKNVAMKNINKVLERGEKIDLLVDKTDRMKNTAVKFHKTVSATTHKNIEGCVQGAGGGCIELLAVVFVCLFAVGFLEDLVGLTQWPHTRSRTHTVFFVRIPVPAIEKYHVVAKCDNVAGDLLHRRGHRLCHRRHGLRWV